MSNESDVKYDVVVIGGGASGLMAAAIAGEQGARVLVLEKNPRLGEKLRISGGGRCNILNAEADMRALLANYGDKGKFLYSAFYRFGMQDTLNYFEGRGLQLKIEARNRAFPASEKAADVVQMLEGELGKHRVEVRTDCEVSSFELSDDGSCIKWVATGESQIVARNFIVATGGLSRPDTGSTGDGFGWLCDMGHDVREPTPNVTPLSVKEPWVAEASGVTLKEAAVSFRSQGLGSFRVKGDILLTHFGLSGPTILNNAYKVSDLLNQGEVAAEIDCYPLLDEPELDAQIIATLEQHRAKRLRNTLKWLVPAGTTALFKELLPKDSLPKINSELSRAERLILVKLLKCIPLSVEGLMGFEKAVVADGGVNLEDIDTRTMRSKKLSNLYITGDLLDINRPSGGFSLQLCWTTGYIAGLSASE